MVEGTKSLEKNDISFMSTGEKETERKSAKIHFYARAGSVAIISLTLGLISGYLISGGKTLKPNEWGDTFAGFAGSLALVWLVAGFLLQRLELRQNSRILLMQAKELDQNTQALEEQARQLEITAIEARKSNEMSYLAELIKNVEKQIPSFPLIIPELTTRTTYEIIIKFATETGAAVHKIKIDTPDKSFFSEFNAFEGNRPYRWGCVLRSNKINALSSAFISIAVWDQSGIRKNINCEIKSDSAHGIYMEKITDEIRDLHERQEVLLKRFDKVQKDLSDSVFEKPNNYRTVYILDKGESLIKDVAQ